MEIVEWKFMYYLIKTRVGVLSDIERVAQPSVSYLIKHDNQCFE